MAEQIYKISEHVWMQSVRPTIVRIGLTFETQHQLGDVIFVEMSPAGEEVRAGEGFAIVESMKSVIDVYAPISGTIVAVNDRLEDCPAIVNEDPYGKGWLIDMRPADSGG